MWQPSANLYHFHVFSHLSSPKTTSTSLRLHLVFYISICTYNVVSFQTKMENGKLCSSHLVKMEMQEAEKDLLYSRYDGPFKKPKSLFLNSPRKQRTHYSTSPCSRFKDIFYSESFVANIDNYALVFFPLSFVTFNIVYWLSILPLEVIFGID